MAVAMISGAGMYPSGDAWCSDTITAAQPLPSAHSAISTAVSYCDAIWAGVMSGTRKSNLIVNIGSPGLQCGLALERVAGGIGRVLVRRDRLGDGLDARTDAVADLAQRVEVEAVERGRVAADHALHVIGRKSREGAPKSFG